jgi:hypothetical protein
MRLAALIACLASGLTGASLAASSPPLPTVTCDQIAGPVKSPRADGYRVVLGIVSVPPAYLPQVVKVQGFEPWKYWEKAGLVVRLGHVPIDVSVSSAWRSRVAITWGNEGPVGSLRIAACASVLDPRGLDPRGWHGYAGGFYLRSRSACVPLTFRVGHRSATVRFGVGRHCGA